MLKVSLLIIIIIFKNISVFAQTNEDSLKCSWNNENKTACLEIGAYIPNNSEYSQYGIDKIVISKREIIDSGAIDLIDVLRLVPDVNITQSGPKGQQSSMFMRGTESRHTLVMINGIPIIDQSTTQGLHDFGVDFIQTVQQIEVFPGSSTTHFGSNAIGGAVNIILTGDYKDSISLTGDKDSNYEFMGNKTFVYDNSSLNFKIGTVNNETISAQGGVDDEKDGVENYTANLNYENYINPNLRFFNTVYLRQTVAEYDDSATKQTGYEGDNKMGTFHFGLENIGQNQKQNSILHYTVYDREYDERGTIDTYESEVIGLKYDFSKTLNETISFGLGSEYKYDWGYFDNNGSSYSSSTKGNIDNIAIYSNLGLKLFKNTNLSFFARNDNHKQTGNNSTYKLNLNYNFDKLELGLSRMTGLRNPTLYELYGSDSNGYAGNRSLNAEKSVTNEFYSNYYINNNLTLSTKLFRSNTFDNIEYVSSPSKKYINDNDDTNLDQSGVNGNIYFKAKNIDINFFASFLSSKTETSSDTKRRPEKNYGLNLNKKIHLKYLGELNLYTKFKHYGKHFDTHSSTFATIEMDSTDIVDFTISKKLEGYLFSLNIDNLLNENYQRPHGYPQNRRQLRIGFRKIF